MWHKFVILLCIMRINKASAACAIDVRKDFSDRQPLLIRPGLDQFVNPQGVDGIINFDPNQELKLYCSSGFASPAGINSRTIIVMCVSDTYFYYDNGLHSFETFICSTFPESTAQATEKPCFNNGIEVKIGFEVDLRFLRTIMLCFNTVTEETHVALHSLTPASDICQTSVSRPTFKKGGYFGTKDVGNLYNRDKQRDTISAILKSETKGKLYIPADGKNFLAKGHLAAMADFIFIPQQRATFYYVNTAPQWQSFNNGNWKTLENGSRKLAESRTINLDVYTGTYGRCVLWDDDGVAHDIYLYPNGPTNSQIPVPALFYKILVNAADDSGIVVIGVNNPYLTLDAIKENYIICNDISDKITWLRWDKNNITKGYLYACSVNEFLHVVKHVMLSVSRLLV